MEKDFFVSLFLDESLNVRGFHQEGFERDLDFGTGEGSLWEQSFFAKASAEDLSELKSALMTFVASDQKALSLVLHFCGGAHFVAHRKQDVMAAPEFHVSIFSSQGQTDHTLTKLAGHIAHEVNNPLTIIIAKVSIMKHKLKGTRPWTPEEVLAAFEKIEEVSFRISAIVRAMRNFSRDASQEPHLKIDLVSVIQDAIFHIADRFKENGVLIDFEREEGMAMQVDGRYLQLSQVFLNLFSNAFDSVVGTAEPKVSVRVETVDGLFRVRVFDSGAGVSPEVEPKLFRQTFSTKGYGKGTGLGLGICKKIIDSHQGRMYFDPSYSRSCFVVEIPMAAGSVSQTA